MTTNLTKPPHLKCQICGKDTLLPTEQVINIKEVLALWEKYGHFNFSKEVREHYLKGALSHQLFQCSSCGFSIFLPGVAGTNKFYEEVTEKHYYVRAKWEHNEGKKDLTRIDAHVVLDIGCGAGEFLNLAREKIPEAELFGVEFSPSAVATARERGFNASFITDLVEALHQFEDGKFDLISMYQVIEHLENPAQVVSIAREKIKDQGYLIVAVPDEEGCSKHYPYSHTAVPPHHMSRWTVRTFREGFKNLGFKVVRTRKEPVLPDYLWPSYLPVMWDEHFWLRLLMFPMPPILTRDKYKKIEGFTRLMKSIGVKNLYGLPGHTLYVLLQKTS
jgi:SAM-dependent methyltransferase